MDNPFDTVSPEDALARGETANEISGFNEATGAYDPQQNLWQPQTHQGDLSASNPFQRQPDNEQQSLAPATNLQAGNLQQPDANAWLPAAQNLKQPYYPQAGMTTPPSGTSPINQQATLGMVDYLKQNLGKSPADANIKSDLDNVSRMVKSGTAYTNWAYCAGILYAAAQKAGVSTNALSDIKNPLAAKAWQLGQRQDTPSVGNFAYWPHGHISMVSDYDPNKNMVRLIGGNQGARQGQYRPVSETGWVPTNYSGVRYYRGYADGGSVKPFKSHAQSAFHARMGIM